MKMKTDVKKYLLKEIKPLECTLYAEMKPLWKLLRILGMLPYVEMQETGEITFCWFSIPVLYSAVLFTTLCSLVISIYISKINFIRTTKISFDDQVFIILNMSTPGPIFFIPISFWFHTKDFVNYVRKFAEFETYHNRLCKNKLKIKLRKRCIIFLALIFSYAVSANIVYYIRESEYPWYQQVVYIFVIVNLYLQLPYCGFLTHILIRFSENVKRNFLKDVLIKYDPYSIGQYRLLYFQIRNLSRNIFTIFVRVVIVFAVFIMFCLTFSSYTCISTGSTQGVTARMVVVLITLIAVTLMIYFMVNRTEMLNNSIGKNFISSFYKNKRNLNFYEEKAARELKIFTEMFKGTDLNISNVRYFSLNQSAFIALVSTMTTYLLIVIQFRNNTSSNET